MAWAEKIGCIAFTFLTCSACRFVFRLVFGYIRLIHVTDHRLITRLATRCIIFCNSIVSRITRFALVFADRPSEFSFVLRFQLEPLTRCFVW